MSLSSFFKPSSVAIIGASASEKKAGYAVLRNLIKGGYKGKIFPVNPKRKEIMGVKAYPDARSLPEPPELAVLVVPPKSCIEAVEAIGSMGTKAFLVISAGFKETGAEGKKLEEALVESARKYNARIIGPNCLGVMDTHTPLNATFATVMPPQGNVSVISQSGALLSAFFDWSIEEMVGFSKVISLGNQADLGEAELIEYLAEDDETKVILAYIEGTSKGTKLIQALKKASSKKPVLILKVGRTESGARASSSHTGSITGSDDAYRAAFRKAGAIKVETMEELFVAAKLFSSYSPKEVNKVVVLTNAGGPGIMCTDALETSGLKLQQLSESTKELLKRVLPPMASVSNPVDVIGDADAERYRKALEILTEREETDAIIVLLTPQLMTEIAETARAVAKYKEKKLILTSFMGRKRVSEGIKILRSHGVPNFEYPEQSVIALSFMNQYIRTRKGHPLSAGVELSESAQNKIVKLLEEYKDIGHMDEYPALEIVEAVGIETPKRVLVKSEEEIEQALKITGLPAVMKVSSPEILHKSDIKGVIMGITTEEEAREAFIMLTKRAKDAGKTLRGILIEETAPEGIDVIIGFKRDNTFGPVITFGLGGIYVEVLKDVSHAIAPVSEEEALSMIKSIRAFPILSGARKGVKADLAKLAHTIQLFSVLAIKAESITEGEINPLRVSENRIMALDARFLLVG